MSEKTQYQFEYVIRTSAKVLYPRLSTPSGLAEWFADNVNIKNGVYSFFWEGSEEQAKLISKKANESVRFQWLEDEGTDYFLEFRIATDPLTKDVALIIVDHVEDDEKDEAKLLWDSQVNSLRHLLGA